NRRSGRRLPRSTRLWNLRAGGRLGNGGGCGARWLLLLPWVARGTERPAALTKRRGGCAGLLGCRGSRIQDRLRLAVQSRQHREAQAGDEEPQREDGGSACQDVGSAAAGDNPPG